LLFPLIFTAALTLFAWAALIVGPAVMLARLISRALVRLIKGK
jgi:hypothetical protein